jgi:hypothetical protein
VLNNPMAVANEIHRILLTRQSRHPHPGPPRVGVGEEPRGCSTTSS